MSRRVFYHFIFAPKLLHTEAKIYHFVYGVMSTLAVVVFWVRTWVRANPGTTSEKVAVEAGGRSLN